MTFGMRGALCNLGGAQAVVGGVHEGRDQGHQGANALRGELEGRFQKFVNACRHN